MLNLRFTAGVGVGISGACGPPLVWCARKPLPSALMSSAALALGLEEHRLPVMGLCLRPKWLQLSLLFSLSLLFLLMRVALKLRSLRLNTPRVSHRGILNTNQRLSQHRWPPAPDQETAANFQQSMRPSSPPCLCPPLCGNPGRSKALHGGAEHGRAADTSI